MEEVVVRARKHRKHRGLCTYATEPHHSERCGWASLWHGSTRRCYKARLWHHGDDENAKTKSLSCASAATGERTRWLLQNFAHLDKNMLMMMTTAKKSKQAEVPSCSDPSLEPDQSSKLTRRKGPRHTKTLGIRRINRSVRRAAITL